MKIEKLLNDEIQAEVESLGTMELGSEPYKVAVDGVTKLIDRSIEIKKLETERENQALQAIEDKKDRWIKDSIAVAGIILPLAVTIWGTRASLKFEETGTVTTVMGRGFINKLLPRK